MPQFNAQKIHLSHQPHLAAVHFLAFKSNTFRLRACCWKDCCRENSMANLFNLKSNLPFTKYAIGRSGTKCPACYTSEKRLVARMDRRLKRITHVACEKCNLIRQYPLPTEEDLAAYYRDFYRSDYQKTSEPTKKHVEKRQKEAANRLVHLSSFLETGAEIIDFGCGSGEFVAACNSAGFMGKGFEPGSGYAAFASRNQGLKVENKGWRDYSVDTPADAVTSFHVFEHLVDPVAALRKAQSWIKPDGLIYIEVPDTQHFIEKKGFGCLHMAHTLAYTNFTLEYIGAVCGMEIIKHVSQGDCGIIFRAGKPRELAKIEEDARAQSEGWTKEMVHRQFWAYTFGKLRSA